VLPDHEGSLIHNLILFGRLLRSLGIDASTGRMMDMLNAMAYIDLSRRADFYHAARCLFVHRREEIPLFDQAFEIFWRKPRESGTSMDLQVMGEQRRSRKPRIIPPPLTQPPEPPPGAGSEDQNPSNEPPVIQATLTYSDREILRRKDFSELSGEEVEAVKSLISGLVWQLGYRRTRRLRPGRGSQLDLRRTIRRNLQYGGDLLVWAHRQPKYKPRPLVIIADISGSMERYTRLLLHFIYSLSEGLQQRVEAFVFSTRLTRISRQLRGRDVDQALDQVARLVPDWSGGTRIGEALKTFNYDWGRRVLGQGAVVLLISDGWDRGDVDLLRSEIMRLQRSCYRLIWLNPLLGSEQYEPLTRGMQTALPYIDDFLPVHNLASLEDLAQHLQAIDQIRPIRRQMNADQKRSGWISDERYP
jgi:uncharacterized protein with von Willebrand factor type A (vWA) domain